MNFTNATTSFQLAAHGNSVVERRVAQSKRELQRPAVSSPKPLISDAQCTCVQKQHAKNYKSTGGEKVLQSSHGSGIICVHTSQNVY